MFSAKVSKNQMIKPIIIGLVASVLSALIILVISAVAATNLSLSDDAILVLALISMSLGAFFGGMAAAKIYKQKGFLIGAINGAIYFFITTLAAFAVNQGAVTLISLIKLIIFVLASMIGGVIGVNVTHKRKF